MFEKLTNKLREKAAAAAGEEISFRNFDAPAEAVEPTPKTPEEDTRGTTLAANPKDTSSNIELKVVRPQSFSDVSTIADYLLGGCTVVLNMEALDATAVLRMLDFLNGVTYSTDGEIKKVAQTTYIVTPHNVDVDEDH